MSESGKEAAGQPRKPLLIENIYEKETSESFVERHFQNRHLHRCRFVAEFNVDAVASEFASDLIRSAQDLEPKPEGNGLGPQWSMLIFHRPNNVFWHFLIKSGGYGTDNNERNFTLTVTAERPEAAAADALMLQQRFTTDENAPGFFLVRDIRRPKRIPLRPEYVLTDEMLDMHYGDGFSKWTQEFAAGLRQSGLSILQGSPGTGKTSFLRHLILTLSESHRFYYLPVDSFGLLQNQVPEFLVRERARFKELIPVLVLEDAEELLLSRREHRHGLTSSLLNFTDGFVGDVAQAHLICTINSEIRELDEAVLRPGRQRFFHRMEPLNWKQSCVLAEKLGITLQEERRYTLAELYHFKDLQSRERLDKPAQRTIGFSDTP